MRLLVRQRARIREVSGSFVTLNKLSMLIKKQADIAPSEITPKNVYLNRRNFLVGAALAGAAAAAGVGLKHRPSPPVVAQANAKIDGIQKSKFSTGEAITPYKDVTNYNNYYEFSTDKYGPAELAKDFKTRPWTVSIEGLAEEETSPRRGFDHQTCRARGAYLSAPMCGGVVDRGAMDRVPAERAH